MDKKQIFYDFLTEYAEFLEYMVLREEEKLKVVLSNKLPELEKSIAVQQTNEKKIENIEKKRSRLQEDAGFSNMSFSEIINDAPENQKQKLKELFDRAQTAVSKIKYFNLRSMDILKFNLQSIKLSNTDMGLGYSKNQQEIKVNRSSILETKV